MAVEAALEEVGAHLGEDITAGVVLGTSSRWG